MILSGRQYRINYYKEIIAMIRHYCCVRFQLNTTKTDGNSSMSIYAGNQYFYVLEIRWTKKAFQWKKMLVYWHENSCQYLHQYSISANQILPQHTSEPNPTKYWPQSYFLSHAPVLWPSYGHIIILTNNIIMCMKHIIWYTVYDRIMVIKLYHVTENIFEINISKD